jgi:hypothetical protein
VATALLWLGLLLGLRHALEADHLATVASLASRASRLGDVVRVAGAWGLGHALVLLVAGAAMALLGTRWPPAVERALELAGGGVLVWLGAGVVRRAWAAGATMTATAAAAAPTAAASRALVIGGLHGVEGSGAVVLLAVPAARSPAQAIAYLAAFGLGSIAGMLACSLAITLPLGAAARRLTSGRRLVQLGVGALSLIVGALVVARALGPG